MPPTPIVKSFLIADCILQDRATGKWSAVGIFDRIYAPSFPCKHSTLAIYVKLADALGHYKVRIEFRDAEDNQISTFDAIELDVANRLQGVEFGVTTHGLPLKKAGKYQFQLFLNGEYVAAMPLEAIVMERPEKPEGA